MPGIARVGDICTGHGDWPPRPATSGSDDVFINGMPAHRVGDSWDVHCNHEPSCHTSVLAAGSGAVFVNGKPLGRTGDPIACGSKVAGGSSNVFAS